MHISIYLLDCVMYDGAEVGQPGGLTSDYDHHIDNQRRYVWSFTDIFIKC